MGSCSSSSPRERFWYLRDLDIETITGDKIKPGQLDVLKANSCRKLLAQGTKDQMPLYPEGSSGLATAALASG